MIHSDNAPKIMRERYSQNGWNIADDDTPKPPEIDALSSPQHRRYLKSLQCSGCHKPEDGININVDP